MASLSQRLSGGRQADKRSRICESNAEKERFRRLLEKHSCLSGKPNTAINGLTELQRHRHCFPGVEEFLRTLPTDSWRPE
jgi:hypothetical protein